MYISTVKLAGHITNITNICGQV